MNQVSLAHTGFELAVKRTRTRKCEFLEVMNMMNLLVPWTEILGLLRRHATEGSMGRPPFALETMLRIHLLQQFFGLSDPAKEEALHDVPLYREFARLDVGMSRMPDESNILRFRHFLEAQHPSVNWHVAMMPSKRRLLDTERLGDRLAEQLEAVKACIRAKVDGGKRPEKRRNRAQNTSKTLI